MVCSAQEGARIPPPPERGGPLRENLTSITHSSMEPELHNASHPVTSFTPVAVSANGGVILGFSGVADGTYTVELQVED